MFTIENSNIQLKNSTYYHGRFEETNPFAVLCRPHWMSNLAVVAATLL